MPIIPFEGEQDDELLRLERFLVKVSRVHDVREVCKRVFKSEMLRGCDGVDDMLKLYKKGVVEMLED